MPHQQLILVRNDTNNLDHQGHVEFYGTPSELLAKGVDFRAVLGLTGQAEDERDQFYIMDEEDTTCLESDVSTIKSAPSVMSLASLATPQVSSKDNANKVNEWLRKHCMYW